MTAIEADRIQPLHEVQDEQKLANLVESMSADGWVGAPIVVVPGQDFGWGSGDPCAITGSHRIAAARIAGIDVEVIEIDELLAEQGTNLAELDDMYGDPNGDHYEAITRLTDHLPADVVERYGLDAH